MSSKLNYVETLAAIQRYVGLEIQAEVTVRPRESVCVLGVVGLILDSTLGPDEPHGHGDGVVFKLSDGERQCGLLSLPADRFVEGEDIDGYAVFASFGDCELFISEPTL